MSLFSDGLVAAADTQEVQAGGQGFLQEAGNALTGGVAGAVISGLGSIYNTAAAGVNAIGGDLPSIDTYKTLENIDTNWAEYYKQHQNAIDITGFVASSLIPGTLAIKALNAVRAGNAANALGRALGFARTMQNASLDTALTELGAEGGTIFTRINTAKLAAMGWGVADQTLTAAAFETGVALTMKQSPLLADDSWWDIGKSAIKGAMFGGIVGGGIDSIILNRGFKDAVIAIDKRQRGYDYQSVYDKFNLDAGDKAYGVMDSLLSLPKEVLDSDKLVTLPFHLAQGSVNKTVDISRVLGTALNNTQRSALQDFEKSLRAIGNTDNEVGAGIAQVALDKFSKLKAAGTSDADIKDQLGDLLLGMRNARPATDTPTIPADQLWYFNKSINVNTVNTVDDLRSAAVGTTPFAQNAYNKPYMFVGNTADQQRIFNDIAFIGGNGENSFKNLTEAWKAGKHVALNPDGSVRVNDSSPYWRRVDDPVFDSSRYLNTKTGAITEDAVLTAADGVPAGQHLQDGIKADAVYLAKKSGNRITNQVISMKNFNPQGDVEYFTARHAWASKLEDRQIPDEVDAADFSLLDRISSVSNEADLERIHVVSEGSDIGSLSDISIPEVIKSAKLSAAQDAFMAAYENGTTIDVRALAYRLNVEPIWLENAVASRFADSLSGNKLMDGKMIDNLEGLSRPLSDYLKRENVIADYARPQQFTELTGIRPDMSFNEKRLIIMDQVAMTGGQFVTGELAWAYRVQAAIQATKTAAAAVLGSPRAGQLIDLAQDAAKLADSVGVGAGFVSTSNASYGEVLKLWAQTTGKLTHQWIGEDLRDVVDSFSTVSTRLRNDPKAGAELGIINNILRSTDEKYVFNPANSSQLMLREFRGLSPEDLQSAITSANSAGRRATIDIENDITKEFLTIHTGLNADRIGKRTVLINARGLQSNLDPETVYAPPIDTSYFKHFAFVRPIEGKAFGTSEVAMVFGRDAGELSKRIAAIDNQNFDVITKAQTEKFFKAKGDYDFSQTINEPRINSELNRSGALNNAFPEVRPENIIEDYIRWHQNQTTKLVRDAVETNYAQQIAELNKLGEGYVDIATSQFSGTTRAAKSEAINPYNDFVKTALDVSKQSEYTFFHQANEFVDALGTRAYQMAQKVFGDANKGIVTWQEANAQMEKFGLKGVYNGEQDFFTANVPRDRNIIREYVSKANAILANAVLRFDFANSVLNTISTPILLGTELSSIRNLVKNDSELSGKLNELTSVALPDGSVSVPSNSKLLFNAIKNFWGEDKEELLTRYKANGDIKENLSQYHSMIDDLSMRADFKPFKDGVDKAVEKVATLTGNNWAEQFTRFVSADVMRQLTDPLVDAGKLSLKEQNAYISVFVNRVQGNYVSSQRPILFQGVLGSAIGLFQTYQFNMLQQLLRHVGDRNTSTIATLFGMQAGLFGLNGLPMFEAVNTHLIGNSAINQGHYDAYSVTPALLGKPLGDWLMYGTASAFPAFGDKWPALYTRGDINPRNVTMVPVNPVDIPAIDASIRTVKNLWDMGSKLVGGANVGTTLLEGLEHNGINRPLAGLAQAAAGRATTSQGSLISASNDLNLIMTASRIAGAKPLDESIALNAVYRNKAYDAADRDRINMLGERVKTYLYGNQFPPDETMDGFMKDYAAAGGRAENFNRSMQSWMKDANVSMVEKLRNKMNSSTGQRLNELMGGVPLPDYRNQQNGSEMLAPE